MRLLTTALLLSLASLPAAAGPVQVTDAWVNEAPPSATNNAAYITLRNGDQADALLGASTPAARVAEVHEVSVEGGLKRMRPVKALELAPGQVLTFAPGGLHIMLVDVKQPLRAGARLPLTLRFRKAGAVTVQAVVRSPEAAADDRDEYEHHHHH